MSDTYSIYETPESESRIKDFLVLLKPRVMSLVVFSGFAGMWIAPGFHDLHPFLAIIAILSLALGAGAAGAANMWFDRDIDAIMKRTQGRPLPMGRIDPDNALAFAIIFSMLSALTMGLAVNWLAASLLAFANFFYVVIYTMWLKRTTPQNIVIGGAAGAFPPLIGWAAVTGSIDVFPAILFGIIFLWTPPHFWALALYANEDYKKANIPMMPVVAGERSTKMQMLVYTIILSLITLLPFILGYTGILYAVSALCLSLFFVYTSIKVLLDKTHKSARLMFKYSIFYLFGLFLALMIDATY